MTDYVEFIIAILTHFMNVLPTFIYVLSTGQSVKWLHSLSNQIYIYIYIYNIFKILLQGKSYYCMELLFASRSVFIWSSLSAFKVYNNYSLKKICAPIAYIKYYYKQLTDTLSLTQCMHICGFNSTWHLDGDRFEKCFILKQSYTSSDMCFSKFGKFLLNFKSQGYCLIL